MKVKEDRYISLQVQLFFLAIIAAIILGLCLMYRGGRSATLFWILLAISLFCVPRTLIQNVCTQWFQWWDLSRRKTFILLLRTFASVLLFSLLAHGFLFANEFFSHDSISVVAYDPFDRQQIFYYIRLGRWMLSLYELLKGPASAPWLIGILFILWTTLAAVFVTRLLAFNGFFSIILASALLCTNTALTLTGATYVYCMDEYALALLMAVIGAWLFSRHVWLLGIICFTISLSLYQAYFTVGAIFCFLSLIPALLDDEKTIHIVRRGILYLIALLTSYWAYVSLWSIACQVTNMEKARVEETALSQGCAYLIRRFFRSYLDFFAFLFRRNSFLGRLFPAITFLCSVMLIFWLFNWLLYKRISMGNKFLLVCVFCILPAVFNVSYILFPDYTQPLVNFGRGLPGIFLLFCAERQPESHPQNNVIVLRRYQIAALILSVALVWQNTVTSNQLYIKKDLEKNSTLSLITRMIERIEQTDGYIPGETPVAFVGWIPGNPFLERSRTPFRDFTTTYEGAAVYNYATTYTTVQYITQYLNYPMKVVEIDALDEIQTMPAFPAKGSIQWVEDTVVVKLS